MSIQIGPKAPVIELTGVTRMYHTPAWGGLRKKPFRAVDEVDIRIESGESLVIIGESGCGKSTVGRLILGLEKPDIGQIARSGGHGWGEVSREPVIRAVFQNPRSSLNPRRRVASTIRESMLHLRDDLSQREIQDAVNSSLSEVGLSEHHGRLFPHQLSGGEQQRVAIAAAVVAQPDLIVLDEPTSALDVSIAAQITNMLISLQARLDCAYLLITHSLSTARVLGDRMAVMYLGKIVEEGRPSDVLDFPGHPYTRQLVDAEPCLHPRERSRGAFIVDEPPSAHAKPSGCIFHPRCNRNDEIRCPTSAPVCEEVIPGRAVACFYPLVEESKPDYGAVSRE